MTREIEIVVDASARHFDKDGSPMNFIEWARKFEDPSYRRVKITRMGGPRFISTIWLGLNHSWGDGPPMIFETMGFGRRGTFVQERYSTLEEAKTGHELLVRKHGGRRMTPREGGYFTKTCRVPADVAFDARHIEVLGYIERIGRQKWVAVAWAEPKKNGRGTTTLGVFRNKRNALSALRRDAGRPALDFTVRGDSRPLLLPDRDYR